MALGISQNTEYLWKVFPEGTLTLLNVLDFTYTFPMTQSGFPSILSGSPLCQNKYSTIV